MHILEQSQPCAVPACPYETTRAYGENNTPYCRVHKAHMTNAHARCARYGGRTWGAQGEIIMSALKTMARRAVRRGLKGQA